MKTFLSVLLVASSGYWSPEFDTPSALVSDIRQQVFKVTVDGHGGTGWVVSHRGRRFTVTNNHVCGDGDTLTATSNDGTKQEELKVLARDKEHDLCLLDAVSNREGLKLSGEQSRRNLYVLGYPHLRPLTRRSGEIINKGEISIVTRMWVGAEESCPKGEVKKKVEFYLFETYSCVKYYETLWTDIEVYPGNSGSPVLNSDDKVVGIVFASDTRVNQGFIVSLAHLRNFLNKSIDNPGNDADDN